MSNRLLLNKSVAFCVPGFPVARTLHLVHLVVIDLTRAQSPWWMRTFLTHASIHHKFLMCLVVQSTSWCLETCLYFRLSSSKHQNKCWKQFWFNFWFSIRLNALLAPVSIMLMPRAPNSAIRHIVNTDFWTFDRKITRKRGHRSWLASFSHDTDTGWPADRRSTLPVR